jgi:polyketide biosynthesis acyl carrier protein
MSEQRSSPTDILEVLRKNVTEVVFGLPGAAVTPMASLRELGADSVERAEILTLTLRDLQLRLPLVALAGAKNVGDLVEIFAAHLGARA